jgi:hypothetical protein
MATAQLCRGLRGARRQAGADGAVNVSDIITQIISTISVAAFTASGIIFLAKTWMSERIKNSIKNEYDQKLETHKAELKAKSDIEIERLRSQLSIIATEHQVRFSRLHDKRAEVIAQTYSTLKSLHFALRQYVDEFSSTSTLQARFEELVARQKAFESAYALNLIFFPEAVANKLDKINLDCIQAANKFRYFVDQGGDYKKWGEVSDTVKADIPSTLRDLEYEFRSLLEVTPPK